MTGNCQKHNCIICPISNNTKYISGIINGKTIIQKTKDNVGIFVGNDGKIIDKILLDDWYLIVGLKQKMSQN